MKFKTPQYISYKRERESEIRDMNIIHKGNNLVIVQSKYNTYMYELSDSGDILNVFKFNVNIYERIYIENITEQICQKCSTPRYFSERTFGDFLYPCRFCEPEKYEEMKEEVNRQLIEWKKKPNI